jgi:hypothetical protein
MSSNPRLQKFSLRFGRDLRKLLLVAPIAACWSAPASAQFGTVINAPPDAPPGILNSDTQLNLGAGGLWSLGFDNKLRAGAVDGSSTNIEINVSGGTIGSPLETYAGATLNFAGGSSNYYFYPHDGSVVNISGGTVHHVYAYDGSVTNVSAGSIDGQAHFLSGSTVNITGGFVGNRSFDSLTVVQGATANISGGAVGVGLELYGGVVNISGGSLYDGIDAGTGSSLNLFGEDFRIDGVPVAGLDLLGSTVALDVPRQSTLSGVYSDGTPFAFVMPYNSIDAGVLSLHRTAVPAPTPGTFSVSSAELPAGLRAGQKVIVGAGETLPDYYIAGRGSEVEVQPGGSLGLYFKADGAVVDVYGNLAQQTLYATGGATLNLHDGQDADSTSNLEIYRDSQLNVSGGDWRNTTTNLRSGSRARFSGGSMNYVRAETGVDFAMAGGSVHEVTLGNSLAPAVLSGGEIDQLLLPNKGISEPSGLSVELSGVSIDSIAYEDGFPGSITETTVTQSAGVVRRFFPVASGGKARLEGGALGGGMELSPGGTLEIVGGEFRVDGNVIDGLETPGLSRGFTLPHGSVLSGTLSDGTPFAFNALDKRFDHTGDDFQGTVTLIAAATPTAMPGAIVAGDHPDLLGVREGQTLVVGAGDVVRDVLNIGRGARVELNAGGAISERAEAVGSELVMTGGTLGDRFDAFSGSVISISGGTVGQLFAAYGGSQVRVSGGQIGDWLFAHPDSDFEISGGEMIRAEIHDGAQFRVAGGELGVMNLLENAEMAVAGGTVNGFNVDLGAHVTVQSGRFGISDSAFSYDQRVRGTVDQHGGVIGESMDVFSGGSINSYAGTIENRGTVYNGGVLNIRGGAVGREWEVESGGKINVEAGALGRAAEIKAGGELKATGGSVGSDANVFGTASIDKAALGGDAEVFSGGRLSMTGGTVGRGLNGRAGSEIHLYGAEFHLGDQLVTGLNAPGDEVILNVPTTSIFSGVLADGSPITLAPKQLSPTLGLDGDTIANGVLRLHYAAPVAATPGVYQASDHPDWFGIRSGQTLIVGSGDNLTPYFTAAQGSTLQVAPGGVVSEKMDALGAAVQIVGGSIGNELYAYDGSTLQMLSGSLGNEAGLFAGSEATIAGGVVGERLAVETGASLTVEGGIIGRNLRIGAGANAVFAGGQFVDGVSAATGSHVELVGANFRLNGALVSGFDLANLRQLNLPANSVLTGTFANSEPFVFSNARASNKDLFAIGTLTLRRVDVPAIPRQVEISTQEGAPRTLGAGANLLVSAGGRLADYSVLGEGSHTEVGTAGAIGNDVELFSGAVHVAGGQIGSRFAVYNAGAVSLNQGSIGADLAIHSGGVLNQFGGSVSATLKVLTGGRWNVFGSNFAINGILLSTPVPGIPYEITGRTGTLTGLLANGASISILLGSTNPRANPGPLAGGSLFVHSVPEAASSTLAIVATAAITVVRRRNKRRPSARRPRASLVSRQAISGRSHGAR